MSFDGSEDDLHPCEAIMLDERGHLTRCGDIGDVEFSGMHHGRLVFGHLCTMHFRILYMAVYKLLLCYA